MAISTSVRRSDLQGDIFLNGVDDPWRSAAPRRVRRLYTALGQVRGWQAWRKHLARRDVPSLTERLRDTKTPLAWALPPEVDQDGLRQLFIALGRLEKKSIDVPLIESHAVRWLDTATAANSTPTLALGCLAWCDALPGLVEHFDEQLWWSLLERLTTIAGEDETTCEPWTAQLFRGELPLALAGTFPELRACYQLARTGIEFLAESFAEVLDGEGLLKARHLPLLRPLLACWTRSCAWGGGMRGSWHDQLELQYAGIVQHALRLTRADGTQVFSSADSSAWQNDFLKSAVRLAADRSTNQLARTHFDQLPRAGKQRVPAKVPRILSPQFQSEWAGLAQLRPSWLASAPRLSVGFDGPQTQLDLCVGKHCLWSGTWGLEVRFNGRLLTAEDTLEQLCWESNAEADYLELELGLTDEVRVQRHILLSRKDGFLFLADAVLGIQPGLIEYRGTLPIRECFQFQPATETREGALVLDDKPRAHVLPLALGEWRGSGRGELRATNAGLELAQSADGECLFAPLFIDLKRKRLSEELTWRTLTVGQDREIVAPEVAVGYRVQIGPRQWLIYRSLAEVDVRTVLGKNLMTEFLVGRLKPDGTVKALLEIE